MIFSDLHLGLSRQAHTTPASSAALQQTLFDHASGLLAGEPSGMSICAGDVFDKFSNPEKIIDQGLHIARSCGLVLAGNHDLVGQEGKLGSLQLVNAALLRLSGDSPIVVGPYGEPWVSRKIFHFEKGPLQVTAVPHVATQALFEKSLDWALEQDKLERRVSKRALVLHCNYNLPSDYLNETTLNLLPQRAEQLLEVYDYVLFGHEHNPTEHFNDRLIGIGSAHPTAFHDLTDKRVLHWNGKEFFEETVWKMSEGYKEIHYSELPASTSVQFLRVVGAVPSSEVLQVSKAISLLWSKSPSLLSVKSDLVVEAPEGGVVERGPSLSLPESIRRDLKDSPELLSLWEQLSEEEL